MSEYFWETAYKIFYMIESSKPQNVTYFIENQSKVIEITAEKFSDLLALLNSLCIYVCLYK